MYIWEPVPICTPSGVDLTPGNVLYTNEAERGGFCAKESFLEFVTIACCKGMDQCSQILMQNRLLFSFALSNALYLSYYLSHVRMIRQKRWLHRLPVNYNSRIILLNRFDFERNDSQSDCTKCMMLLLKCWKWFKILMDSIRINILNTIQVKPVYVFWNMIAS